MVRSAILLLLALGAAGCRSALIEPLAGPPPLRGERWEVRFEGNETLAEDELREAMEERLVEFHATGLTKPGVDDAAYELELYYRGQGFARAYVDYSFAEREGEGTLATFLIEEGPRIALERLVVRGHASFEDEELHAFFPEETSETSGDEPRWYVHRRLVDGVGAMRSFYRLSGFLAAEIAEPAVELDEAGTRASAEIVIVEGPRFVLATQDVTFHGELGFAGQGEEVLRRRTRSFLEPEGVEPPPYTPRLAHALRAHLLALYGSEGYPDCRMEIEPETDPATGRVLLAVHVETGDPVRINRISITGNEKTRGSFIRSRLDIEEGDGYDSEEIRTSFGKLYATGLFDSVTIELAEDSGTERELVVDVVEAPSIELFVEPGYGSYEGPRLRFGAEERNVLGTGRSLRAESTVGPRAQNATVGILDPALFRTDLQGSGSVFFNHREEPSFTLQEWGTGIELTHAWPEERLVGSVGYRFRLTELTDVDVVDPLALEIQEDVDISSISASVTRDSRDHLLVPRRGNRARLHIEWASSLLGSEIDYLAARISEAHFFPLPWEGGVLGLSARTGLIEPIADTEAIPLSQRLFNGGENTVRSFRESELGPHDPSGEPLGGETFTALTAELRQELFGQFAGALFFDAGNVAREVDDYFEFNGMRTGVGVGVRYLLPIGPLRVDAALNPNARDGEDEYVIHFSVGMSF